MSKNYSLTGGRLARALPLAQAELRYLAVRNRLAMSQLTTCRWSFMDDIKAYRRAGFSAVGIWRPKLAEFGEEHAIDLLAQSGLSVASLSWAGGFTGSDGFTHRDAIQDAADAVELAGRIRAGCLVIVSGDRGGHTSNHARRLVVEALQELGDAAGSQGVQLALQSIHPNFAKGRSFVTRLEQLLDIVDRCNHPHVGIAFDVYQLWQECDIPSRLAEIVPFIKTVQLSDWSDPPRSDQDRCRLGLGVIPLVEMLTTLEDAGYQGWYDLQIISEEIWQTDYDILLADCQSDFQALIDSALLV